MILKALQNEYGMLSLSVPDLLETKLFSRSTISSVIKNVSESSLINVKVSCNLSTVKNTLKKYLLNSSAI